MRSERFDVVVIGCGVAGAWTALFLAQAGVARIAVFDKGQAGSGASTRGTGLVRVHHANHYEMAHAMVSRRYYRDWSSLVGVGSSGWRGTGVMWIVGPMNKDMLSRNVAAQRAIGDAVELLDPERLQQLQPHIAMEGVAAAAYEPDSGTAVGAMVMDGLVSMLVREGVTVRTHQPIVRILTDADGVTGIATETGLIHADRVVLAAGAWSAQLAQSAGVDLPVIPTYASLGTAHYPAGLWDAIAFFDETVGTSFAPKMDGSWGIVPVRDHRFLTPVDPDRLGRRPPLRAAQDGLALISTRIPTMAAAVLGDRWSAVDGVTADGRPVIGEHPDLPGLFLHVGGNFKGFKMAPGGALGLVAEMTGRANAEVDTSAYGLARFRNALPRPWDEAAYAGSRWT